MLLKGFRYIDIKKKNIISVPYFVESPNEFGSVLNIKDLNISSTLDIKGKQKVKDLQV